MARNTSSPSISSSSSAASSSATPTRSHETGHELPADSSASAPSTCYPLLIAGAVVGTIVVLVRHAGESGYTTTNVLESGVLVLQACRASPSRASNSPFRSTARHGRCSSSLASLPARIARYLTRSWLIAIALASAALFITAALQMGTIEMGWERDGLLGGAARVLFGFFAGLLLHDLRPRFSLPAVDREGTRSCSCWASSCSSRMRSGCTATFWPPIVGFPDPCLAGQPRRARTPIIARAGGFLGALSYPLYILHWPIVDLTRGLLASIDPDGRYIALWMPLQIFALVVAVGVVRDEAVRRAGARLADARHPPQTRRATGCRLQRHDPSR